MVRNRTSIGVFLAILCTAPNEPPAFHTPSTFFLRSISRQIMGVKTSCMVAFKNYLVSEGAGLIERAMR
jgi:hypothetical protein